MADKTDDEELNEQFLRALEEQFPETAARVRRWMIRAKNLDPISITIEVGSERPAENAIELAKARLDAALAATREAFESEGVRWEDVPDDDLSEDAPLIA